MKNRLLLFSAALLTVMPAAAATPKDPFNESPMISKVAPIAQFNFDQSPPGVTPRELKIISLNGHAADLWKVSGDIHDPLVAHALAYGGAKATSTEESADLSFDDKTPEADHRAWSAAFVRNISLDTGDLMVSLKMGSASDDRAGILYRYQDPSTFYLLETDPGGEFVTLYRVQKGKWKTVNRVSAIVTADTWHLLRLIFQKDVYEFYLDNELVIGGRDKQENSGGRLGVAVSAEGHAAFNHLVIRPPAVIALPPNASR